MIGESERPSLGYGGLGRVDGGGSLWAAEKLGFFSGLR